MPEKIFEIRIVNVEQMPPQTQQVIEAEVAKKPIDFRENYRGFAKVTYVTASPPRIVSVEPIVGTVIEYIKSIEAEGVDFSIF